MTKVNFIKHGMYNLAIIPIKNLLMLTMLLCYFTSGPPTVEELPQQLHVVLGEQLRISCTATNDQDAPMNLIFSWVTPNSVMFNMTTPDEDDSRTATSTLHINAVTRNHNGVYTCNVTNSKNKINGSSAVAVVIEGKPF